MSTGRRLEAGAPLRNHRAWLLGAEVSGATSSLATQLLEITLKIFVYALSPRIGVAMHLYVLSTPYQAHQGCELRLNNQSRHREAVKEFFEIRFEFDRGVVASKQDNATFQSRLQFLECLEVMKHVVVYGDQALGAEEILSLVSRIAAIM